MFENNQLTVQLGYILVVALSLSAQVLFFVKRWLERDLYGKPNQTFYELFALMQVVDLVWSVLEYNGVRIRSVAFLANMLWYVFFLCICCRWLEVCLKNLSAGSRGSILLRFARMMPALLASIFVASSWWTGWAITTTPSGSYFRGPYLPVIYLVALTYLLATGVLCVVKGIRSQEVTKRRFAYTLLMATGPLVVSVILQYATAFAFFPIGVIITIAFYDFDVHRRAMEVLTATDKARHDAFTMVSHDIRTPLNVIIGLSELLQDEPSEEERRRMQHAILASSRTLLQLVTDVLDMAKLEAGKLTVQPEPTDLLRLVDSVNHVFTDSARERGLVLVNDVPDHVRYVVDPQRIRQILFNLIGNAIKFTDAGKVVVAASYRHGSLSLSVSDTGCGIAPQDQLLLTNPYTQVGRHKGHVGTGLGLTICKRLAVLMGGRLTIESELGKGSTFTVTIPCDAREDRPSPSVAATPLKDKPGHRILMVDDAPLNLKVMSVMLEKLGQRDVVLAHDGEEALSLLKADPTRFDLVLTDLQMPKMDGDELLREIRADPRLAHLPVHVITADIQARTDCADLGFSSIVIKPVTLAKLGEIL